MDNSEEIKKLLHHFKLDSAEKSAKSLFFISGTYGTGKSVFVDNLKKSLIENGLCDVYLSVENRSDLYFFADLPAALLKGSKRILTGERFEPYETAEIQATYRELIAKLRETDTYLFEKAFKNGSLNSIIEKKIGDDSVDSFAFENGSIEKKLTDALKNPIYAQLLINHRRAATESFFVDLITQAFPIDGARQSFTDFAQAGEKLKILVVFDNIDRAAGSAIEWLGGNFFNYAYVKTLGDFSSFEIPEADSKVRISDLLDIKAVFASREMAASVVESVDNKSFSKRALYLKKTLRTDAQIKNYFQECGVKIDDYFDFLKELTFGIPYLLSLWAEYVKVGAAEWDDLSIISNKAADSILKYKTEDQKDWVRCAAYLKEFDENGLRCFPIIGGKYKKAFKYLEACEEITQESASKNKIVVREEISFHICKSIQSRSEKIHKEFTKIAEIYRDVGPIFDILSQKEAEALRNLAYFERFDRDFALKAAFRSDADVVIDFVNNNPQLLIENEHTFSLRDEIAAPIRKFNRIIDLDKYEDKIDLIRRVWISYSNELKEKTTAMKSEFSKLKEKIDALEKEAESKFDELKKINNQRISAIIDSDVPPKKYFMSKDGRLRLVSLALTFVFAALALFAPDFFGHNGESETSSIQIFFGIITALFLFLTLFYERIVRQISGKEESNAPTNFSEQMKILKKEIDSIDAKLQSAKARAAEIDRELETISKKIEESFI